MNDSGQPLRDGVEHALTDMLDASWWANYQDGQLHANL